MKLIAEFKLSGLPQMINSIGRKHWMVKVNHKKEWRWKVWKEVEALGLLGAKFERIRLELVRHSTVEPDFDNLASGFKDVLDGLVKAEVIPDDKPSIIGSPVMRWERVPKGHGFVTVRLFEPPPEQQALPNVL